ncbi:hypothetical protein [uncultured Desulfovibrio sp.]|uniref:hypothetical protein n=1 Tax=uncultured Desulfovibrio sp. TaxID=167968 RepID=UPI00261495F4|nr:hypothetical protein [uncultured Desulfovibrio sp.]
MLAEKIRSVGIALGELAGRVNPDDWRRLSELRDDLALLAADAENMETGQREEAPAEPAATGGGKDKEKA